ncbi:MAG: hypothetical protein JOY55_08540 [Mycobacterium sp.]|nr:hypothetical protein [Mycobacterium sp.]
MQAVSRPYVMAGAVLAAASVVAVTPSASRPFQLPILSIDTRLVDASDSILNIPANLFDDFVNIPNNEVQGLGTLADSLFFSGDWWVPSSTNLWGIDPGDTTHVAAVLGLLPLFPAFTEGVGGLAYELDGFLAAELPVSASCDATACAPIVPPDVITGITTLDRDIGFLEALSGLTNFGLFDNWFTVQFSTLATGYTFNAANDPGVVSPAGPVYEGFGFDNGGSNPFIGGTVYDPTTGQYDMPWDGVTYQLNLLQPFENFFNSLLAPPSTDGIFGSGIEIPSLTEFTQALQADAAALVVAFDPLVPGSPACPGACDGLGIYTVPQLVQAIGNLDPGNPMINEWLADVAASPPTDNNATPPQTDASISLLQTGFFNLTPTELANVDSELASINPELPALLTNIGILTDPGYLAYGDGLTTTFDPVYGGIAPSLVVPDLEDMLGPSFTTLLSNPEVGSLVSGAADDIASSLQMMDSALPLETFLNFATLSL